MRVRRTLAYLVFASCVLLFAVKNRAADVLTGDWTIRKAESPGKVEFGLIYQHGGHHSDNSSDWPASSFQGVDFSQPGRQEVHFTITRDAGKIDCEGFLKDGEGAGTFRFQPAPNYPREMSALGFTVDEEKQFGMAVQDVSLEFARQMKGEHLSDLDADKLVAFRIFNVDSAFIQQLRADGLQVTDSDKLVAFRIHGVTPELVRNLHSAGYSPDEDTLIALRIHGATPEWMNQLKQQGYDHVELQKLIAFRIHGVSPEFISKVQALGYPHPAPDELIAMRIHNVTPEYISGLRDRGLKNLTIDQLVGMRIQGID